MKTITLLFFVVTIGVTMATQYYNAEKDGVDGQFIVVLKDGIDLEPVINRFLTDSQSEGIRASIRLRYNNLLTGFVAKVTDGSRALQLLMALPGVDYIEQDKIIRSNAVAGSWGIDRIDQRSLPLNNNMDVNGHGSGAHVYIIDTGINPNHVDFGGRATPSKDFVDVENGDAIDCNGHGTHCAGTVGSNTYGIAREANLYGIRILDCDGSGFISSSVAAMDWLASEGKRPTVASMSYGGFFSPTEMRAAKGAKEMGVVLVTSAGNSNADACLQSPAGSPDVITVGATTSSDARSSYSNYGRCVDLFAPGSSITSLTYDSNDGVATYSGTSMACPHVAGIAAVLFGQGYSPQEVYDKVTSSATFGVVANPNGSPNLLAYLD
ncbi:alkaline serine exoprotease A-like [Lytechinus pictus]|uniref:alkaline serine exoprotease A-like n=1 Tax=Lytechinus pictus TaxID=7653 RepID=UPI0030B9ECD4